MATKKRAQAAPPPPDPSGRFFARELAGEPGPPLELMGQLCALSGEFFALQPWKRLNDSDLILFQHPLSGEMCFCSIMGALGEVFSLHAFIGAEGYRAYRSMAAGDPEILDTIFTVSRSVYVELVSGAELTPPDRGMLRSVGASPTTGGRAPIFRALRPGYHPWHPNEAEARLLRGCLGAVCWLVGHLEPNYKAAWWPGEERYPQVFPGAREGDYEVKVVKPPPPAPALLELPNIDEKRVAAILKSGLPSKGVLELDHFHARSTIGKKHERKACMGLAIAIDAKTAYAFPPQIGSGATPVSRLLPEALLTAIETSRAIPLEVHVRNRDRKRSLDRLARELGFRLRATESLPAFDFCKEQLMAAMAGGGC